MTIHSRNMAISRCHLKIELRAYLPFRDELAIYIDLISKGFTTLIIPKSETLSILRKLHASHLEYKIMLLARNKVFWSTIRQDRSIR